VQSLKLIEVRQLLREKFPGLRTRADEMLVKRRDVWATGIAKLDARLGGGFPRSAISEVVAPKRGSGSALLMLQLLRRASQANQFTALVDGLDSFDAAAVEQSTLNHLLWIRCHNADEAIKATDLVLRDGNLPVVLLDLVLNPEAQLRKIPAPTWYRFQRIVEESTATFIVLTPRVMVSPAEVRITLQSRFGLDAIEADQMKLTMELDFHVAEAGEADTEEPLRKIA
jgi:hypothetical protein